MSDVLAYKLRASDYNRIAAFYKALTVKNSGKNMGDRGFCGTGVSYKLHIQRYRQLTVACALHSLFHTDKCCDFSDLRLDFFKTYHLV